MTCDDLALGPPETYFPWAGEIGIAFCDFVALGLCATVFGCLFSFFRFPRLVSLCMEDKPFWVYVLSMSVTIYDHDRLGMLSSHWMIFP